VIRDSVFGKEVGAIKKYADYAGSIHTSGRHLLSLISEILDLSKIEAGSYVLDVTTLDMREVMEGALTIISSAAHNAGVELRYVLPDEPAYVSGDDRSIRQVALNLLANAVKFTPAGGCVSLELGMRAGFVEFAISDTGIGIAKEHLDAVFEPFRQVDASIRRRHEGTGLGLAITKRLVELHGGRIVLESEPGIGTTVRVKLPPAFLTPTVKPRSAEAAA
jgi:cell cycle sensor histidine kinase DivJ